MGRLRAFVVAAAIATTTGLGLVPLVSTAPAGATAAVAPTVDPTDRASVLAAYRSILVEARAVPT
ncbi:MAG TPA: hypothetical protein VK507_09495, partial [Iamia sp.]|nr:hypothetical protein [Iamia sp.]